MPIAGIPQPELLQVSDTLRLRRFDDHYAFAAAWYQDPELVYLVDGVRRPYTRETLDNMYHYLDKHGELYFIEALEDGAFRPIGDVTFSPEDLPIVIGEPAYRGRGVGRQVLEALIGRGRELGLPELRVREIYTYNLPSRKCFAAVGFREWERTEKGVSMRLDLHTEIRKMRT